MVMALWYRCHRAYGGGDRHEAVQVVGGELAHISSSILPVLLLLRWWRISRITGGQRSHFQISARRWHVIQDINNAPPLLCAE